MPPILRTRIFRGGVAVCGAAALTVALTSCGSSGTGGSSGADDLTITLPSAPTSLNPWSNRNGYEVMDAPYDTLIHYSSDGRLEPWLATSWKFTDPKTLELKLQEGVKFTDGTAFDAAAVKANFQYAIDNKSGSGDQTFLQNIGSMDVVDATTIDLHLKGPNPALPYDFSQYSGAMVSPKALTAPKSLDTAPVGTGPYVLDEKATRTGLSYVFKRNPDYWAKDKKAFPFDKVTYTIATDPTAATNAAKSAQTDTLMLNPGDKVPSFKTVTSDSGSSSGFTGIWVDTTGSNQKALADVRVRQAMNYAIDAKKVAAAVYPGSADPVPAVPVAKGNPGHSDQLASMYPYDVAKAKSLLAAAGYAKGFSIKMLSLPVGDQYAQAVAGYLKAVGITVKVENHSTDLVQQLQSGTFPVGLLLQRLTGDPGQDFGGLFTSNAFFNVKKTSDPKIDSLLQEAAKTTDATARNGVYQKLALHAAEQAWFLGALELKTVTAYNPKTLSVSPPPRGQIHLYAYQLPS
ncbi:ABC transporter substrate-binding protein [Streptomyces heilongjiangensis]|uniref:ABC transporter substrate-binding protein n=1 Tax=Streptomyces heilongjiangensis TaxID=945052 RepID=A0ABW1BIL2_9ACTN|nr:ABC transporter substrate-binding protein [Streptomyces heilongjiangensis]MDC2951957.1 ABC transporter substrate-binding protein [Streptomyces heilongjiangensis]